MSNFNTGMARQQIIQALTKGLNAVTQSDLNTALASKADESEIVDLKSIIGYLLDTNGKNILNWTEPSALQTVTFTNNGDGTFTLSGNPSSTTSIELAKVYGHAGESFVLSGCPEGGSQANGYSLLVANQGGSMIGADEGSGYSFMAPAGETYFRVYARLRSGTYSNLLYKPMLCTPTAWAFSHDFARYCPTNAELLKMIQSG